MDSTSTPTWTDVTALCRAACAHLTDKNPMIQSTSFSLHDSMSAIELMDPKMDHCCGLTGEVDMQTLLRIQYEGPLTPDHACKLIAVLINFEVAYYEGASILESTHQCKLLWPESWSTFSETHTDVLSRVVLLYSKLTYLSLSFSHRGIIAADVYEDEDFHVVQKPSLQEYSVGLDEVMTQMNEVMKDLSHSQLCSAEELSFIEVAMRLRGSLTALSCAFDHTVSVMKQFKDAVKESNSTSVLPDIFPDMDALHASVSEKASVSAEIVDSLLKCTFVDISHIITQTTCPEIDHFFAPTLVRLTQTSFIRKIEFKLLKGSLSFISTLCKQFRDTVASSAKWYEYSGLDVEGRISRGPLFLTFDTLLGDNLEYARMNLCAVVRSLLWSCLHIYRPITALMYKTSMICRGLPGAIVDFQYVSVWVESQGLSNCLWLSLRYLMTVRSKQLHQLERSFPHWAKAIQEAEILDNTFRRANNIPNDTSWFKWWILIPVTLIMDTCMGLKLEMELVAENEFDYFYWYWDYICSTRVFAFNSIRELRLGMDRELHKMSCEAAHRTVQKVATMKKMKRKKEAAARDAVEEAEALAILNGPDPVGLPLLPEELYTRTKSQICRGVMRLFLVASKLNSPNLVKTEYPFGPSWSHRFMHRFRSFVNIPFPHLLPYERFTDILDSQVTPSLDVRDIAKQAGQFFKTSKVMIEESKKFQSIIAQNPPDIFTSVMNTHDIVPLRSCTDLLKVGVVGALTSYRLEEQLKTMFSPQEETASSLTKAATNGNPTISDAASSANASISDNISCTLKCNFSHNRHFAIPEMTLTMNGTGV